MKKKFMKGSMVLFALFVIFAFTGCQQPTGNTDNNGSENGSSGGGVDTQKTETLVLTFSTVLTGTQKETVENVFKEQFSSIQTQTNVKAKKNLSVQSFSIETSNNTAVKFGEWSDVNNKSLFTMLKTTILEMGIDFERLKTFVKTNEFTTKLTEKDSSIQAPNVTDTSVDNTDNNAVTYTVSKIVFVDQNGTAPSTSSSPTWSNIWDAVKTSATTALNTTFGTSNWQQSVESPLGTVTINSGYQDITLAKLDALKAVFASTFTIQSVEYSFTANYSAETKTITVTYTQKTSAGDSGNTGDNGNQGGVGDTGETTYTVIEIKLVDKDGNSPSDNSTPTWDYIWYDTKDSINSIFNTAFTSNGWDSLQLTNTYGTIPINAGFQEINKAKYDALISSLNTKLDFTQVNVTYDFTASYDSTTKKITVMYLKPGESGNPGDGGDNGDSGNQGDGSDTETPTAPSAPTNVKATRLTDNTVKITWDAVPNATSYEVFYGYHQYMIDTSAGSTSGTSLTIPYILGNTYYYVVMAKNNIGLTSRYSSSVKFSTSEPMVSVKEIQFRKEDGSILSRDEFENARKTVGLVYTTLAIDIPNSKYTVSSGKITKSFYDDILAWRGSSKNFPIENQYYILTYNCINVTYSASNGGIIIVTFKWQQGYPN